ncbi:MAG TPA: hypothetical protein VJ724_15865 [Tahibacter sp.]|nr:hypothetical protein [Tahibacter sp.]
MAMSHVLAGDADAGYRTIPARWRTRWFWRWQAWRLRKHRAQDTAGGVRFASDFDALEQHGYTDALFDLHNALAHQAPGLLPEGDGFFRERLRRELDGMSAATLFVAPDGSIGGYCWASVGSPGLALARYRLVPTLAGVRYDEWLLIEARAGARLRDAPLIALNALGLGNAYRHGFAPIKKLLKPLVDMGLRCGARRMLWWAPRTSAAYDLSLAFGADRVLETPIATFFVLEDVRPLAQVFAALPASGIADLLGRVAPPRPPRPERVATAQEPVVRVGNRVKSSAL